MLDTLFIILGLLLVYLAYQKKRNNQQTDLEEQIKQREYELERERLILANQRKKKTQNYDPSQQTIYLCYGSQSGTAARFANILANDCEEHNLQPRLIDMMDYQDMILNDKNVCVFLMATHGEGEPTDNAKQFYNECNAMKREQKNNSKYKDMKYTVFGLGKSSYEHYNYMGKWTDSTLQQLGGQRVHKMGLGDDMGSMEDDFDIWKKDLFTAIKGQQTQQPQQQQQHSRQKKKNELVFEVDSDEVEGQIDMNVDYEFQTKQWLMAKESRLTQVYEVRQNSRDGSTLHLELDLKNTDIEYETGMNLAIFAKNTDEKVKQISDYLNLNLENVIKVSQIKIEGARPLKYPFASQTSIRTILQNYIDFQGPLTKKQLKDLAQFVKQENKKEELLEIAKDKKKFNEEIEKKKKGLFDVMKEYEIVLGLKDLVNVSNRIGPRLYTISSSRLYHGDRVHVTASLSIEGDKVGLASQYFQQCEQMLEWNQEVKVLVDFRKSNFILPEDINKRVVMVGPGAGIAPFRGFIWENYQRQKMDKQKYEMTLYFGCRYKEGDYIYRDEIEYLQKEGAIQNYHVAFSREQQEKVYVQNLIEKNKEDIKQLIDDEGVIYLCGNTSMGNDVQKILIQVIQEKNACDYEQAKKQLMEMEKKQMYIKELWG